MSATLVYPFAVTIPAGTTKAVPLVTLTQFERNEVEQIEWTFPAGCNGQVGIQLGARSVAVLPTNAQQWFTTSGDTHAVDVEGMHNSGDWSVIGYNLGAFPHTIQVVFRVRRIEPQVPEMTYWSDFALSNYADIPVDIDG